jgi:hypothetical protein
MALGLRDTPYTKQFYVCFDAFSNCLLAVTEAIGEDVREMTQHIMRLM